MNNGTFFGTFDSKINEWESLIKKEKNEEKKLQLQYDMYNYMAECLPYITAHVNDTETEESYGPFDIKIIKGVQRREIYTNYLKKVENITDDSVVTKYKNYTCKNCGSSNIFVDYTQSENICEDCGVCDYFLGEELTYKEEQETSEKIISNSYKRDNHLNEWILQFQGREMTTIPKEVIEQLRSEFKKQKIKDVKEITQVKVKSLLKKLRLSKYYEHATYITNMLNGLEPPVMSYELEEKLRQMFREVQEPFEKHCPPTRNNFLSYSYILYKFCELLGEDQYLPYFPLLKSKEKLRQQDVIWKGICNELKWEYIATC